MTMLCRYLPQSPAPAWCTGTAAPDRHAATRLLAGACTPTPDALARAQAIAQAQHAQPPGRVVGAGRFTDAALRAALQASLPAELQPALRPEFEWYGCRGAHFHTDAHYGDVLFGAWCLAGPRRDLMFSRGGARLPMVVGDYAVFDPFEPHAVLEPGRATYAREDCAQGAVSLFAAFELALTPATEAAFGILRGARAAGAVELSSRVPVNAETGALAAATTASA